jgi:hypothetical protein
MAIIKTAYHTYITSLPLPIRYVNTLAIIATPPILPLAIIGHCHQHWPSSIRPSSLLAAIINIAWLAMTRVIAYVIVAH